MIGTVAMMELVGRMARGRGGGILRIRPPADVTDLNKGGRRPHVVPSRALLLTACIIAAGTPNGHRATPLPLAPWTGRPRTMAAAVHGVARRCRSG